jgi:hypothetical protein
VRATRSAPSAEALLPASGFPDINRGTSRRSEFSAQVRDHELRAFGHLLPGVAEDDEAGAAQLQVAPAIAVGGRGGGVARVVVQLDDHPLRTPKRVDLETGNADVDLRYRQPLSLDQQMKAFLEHAARLRKLGDVTCERSTKRR